MQIRPKLWLALLIAVACLGSAHAQSTCVSDHDCQDGSWCNGVERCVGNPGRNMCMPAARPMCSAKKRCEETAHKCISPDKDKELHLCPQGQAYSTADEKCVATPQK